VNFKYEMENKSFTVTIEVAKSPQYVFRSITNDVAKWWGGKDLQGSSKKLNDEFINHHPGAHYSKQKLVEVVPNKKVVWLVTESKLNFIKKKNEWTGTKISFEISEINNKTQVRFTHEGLVNEIECYDACSNAWSALIQQSLFSLITTGKGKKVF